MANLISDQNLGAWMLRCNPDTWDLAAFIADGGDLIDDWSVVNNYRIQMMAPGDRVGFWASGNGKAVTMGIWGIGHVTGEVHDTAPSGTDEAGYWLDETARLAVSNNVDVDIPLFDSAVSGAELGAAGIDDLEVQLERQASNLTRLGFRRNNSRGYNHYYQRGRNIARMKHNNFTNWWCGIRRPIAESDRRRLVVGHI